MSLFQIYETATEETTCSLCGCGCDPDVISFMDEAEWITACEECSEMLERIMSAKAKAEDKERLRKIASRHDLENDAFEELKRFLDKYDSGRGLSKCAQESWDSNNGWDAVAAAADSASSIFHEALDAFNDEEGKISNSFGQYRVMQVVLREKFVGKGSKNFREIEDLCNQQYAEGYRLHTFAQSTAHSTGMLGGDRTVCNLVFEKMN